VARAIKGKPDDISALNPAFIRDRLPPDRGVGALRIPMGTATQFAAGFDRGSGAGDALETVTLRFGESLDELARTRKTTARELRRINGVRDSAELRAGVAILVPRRKGASPAPGGDDKTTKGTDSASGAGADASGGAADSGDEDEILVAVPDRTWNYEGRDRVFYRTRGGDNLDEIGETLGVAPDDLVEWNNLDPTAKLHTGMVLQAFVRKDFDPTAVVLLDSARVRAVTLGSEEFLELETARRGKKRLVIQTKSGDTLVKIGRRYGLTVGDLARINRFSSNTDLRNGQKIVVYAPMGDAPREVARGLTPEPRRDRGASRVEGKSSSSKTTATRPSSTKAVSAKSPRDREGSSKSSSNSSSNSSSGTKKVADTTSTRSSSKSANSNSKSGGAKSAPAASAKKK